MIDWTTLTSAGFLAVLIQVVGWFWFKERLKRSIKHEYDKDLEKLRHDLEIESDKKKRLYQGKLFQYKKYYQFIDESSEVTRKELFEKMQERLLALIQEPSNENLLSFINSMLEIIDEQSNKFLKFKNEINGLRLESGEELLGLLDKYTEALKETHKKTIEFFKSLDRERFINDNEAVQEEISTYMKQIEDGSGAQIKKLKEQIFREMRRELGIDSSVAAIHNS